MSVVRSGIQSPEIGIVHVTIIRLHHSSDSGKNPPSQKYFAKVTINDAVETTKDKTLIQGWNEDFTFEIPVPCKFAIKVFRRRKLRRWSDVLIGSYTEDLEALLIRSFDKSISEPLPSGSQLNAGTSKFLIEFKVNLKDQDVVGAISAMVQRVKIQASRLAKSQAMHDSASFNRMQLIGDIHFVNIVEIWDHLLEKLQIFANLADKVAEVHPYAKAAYSVISMAYKAVMKQLERDANINCLILAMDDIYSFVKEAEPLQQIESHKLIMARLAQQTTECGYFISAYCVDTFLMRTVKYAVSPVDAAITMYGSKLNELKSALLAHSTINTEITVLRIWETVKKLEMKIDINDLPYANGVRFQSDKQCLPETQEGILHTIINWIDDLSNGDQRIFVLTGLPGTGKSAIAHSISSHYHSVGRLGSSIFADLPKPESYTSTGLPVLLFPTMARDLADLDIQFRNALWTVIESDRALTKTIGISDQCEKFILGPSTSLTISGPIVIVLDGLDDCLESTDLYAFLKVLANKSHHLPPNFRILLIARNDSHILQHLAGNPVVIFYSMEVDEWVMKCELSQVCRKTLLPYFTQEKLEPIIVELVERARGSFRWIIEACETICGNTFQQETSALSGYKALIVSFGKSSEPIREPVAQNDCLYMEELSRLHRTYGTLFSTQFKPVMGYLLAAYTPLSMLELIRLGRLDDRLLAQFLTAMESLLTNTHRRYQPIGPVHASFYKFLGHSICSKEFSVDIAEYHFDLGRACLQIIDNELKSNVDNLTLLYNPESQELYVGGSFQRYIKVELSYACRFWLKHLKTALGRGLKALNTEVQIGLRAKLQYWCSILHIPGSVGGAIEALHQIMSTMLVSLGSQSLAAVPSVVVLLIDEDSKVRKAVVNCIPELAKHGEFSPS
ncbi:hypothetical protein BT96DRAFT_1021056 [Gymnopus androsaceus JB14]|uniref:C2 domain-containing protein n=1 Tax=Gymnopus androsaceus JB14 TaxID=1447944 RepID=A0A6A4HH66_9AGAR|nr:hypothetical protein BT96DRAFT_1021056 [Gymnopus androsaceus JB14]